MNLSQILDLILGVLQFPGQVSSLLSALRSTPVENHDALIKTMLAEAENFKTSGRPTWP